MNDDHPTRRGILGATAPLLVSASTAFASEAQRQGPDVEAVRHMNENYFRSWVEYDLDWYRKNLADSFLFIGGDGQVLGKDQFLSFPPAKERIDKAHFEDLDIRVYGSTAIVAANTVVTWKNGERTATRYIDVYSKIDGQWKAVSAQLTRDKGFKKD